MKGGIEAVLPFCAKMRTANGDKPLEQTLLVRQAEELAASGFRVLAVAVGGLPFAEAENFNSGKIKNLTFLGLTGFMDPLRPEVKEAVSRARAAGVRVVMVTGDHPLTAATIANDLGSSASEAQIMTGEDMRKYAAPDAPEFLARLKSVNVFARVSPEQKLNIVDGMVKSGEFVAVTGDGVNDAPALNRANIGVAMGSGTEVAKDASQIIVTDDNFASIVNGIEEGRFAYANVRKVTLFLISTGFAELVLIGLATLFHLPVPFLAAQILWLNLVTNGIQDVALAFEAGEKGVMKLPPRSPKENIFNRSMIEQVLLGGLTMAALCLGAWRQMIGSGWEEKEARNVLLTLMIVLQFYHALNCRSEHRSVFKVPLRDNRVLLLGMIAALAIHLGAMHWSLTRELLRIEPLSLATWLRLSAIAAVLLAVMEAYKWSRNRRNAF
jgi:magnesium-transporting ATPase (P-type)